MTRPVIAEELAAELADVRVVRLEQKGRGRALHSVWSTSDAPVLAYMDVDLSTDLAALAPLVAPLISGHSDLAIGTRLGRGARVVRGPKREIISRCYNLILKSTLAAGFSDAQCGFKAVRADVAQRLLPHITDTGWFFDTELLVLAERIGLRIHEVPVDWVDDPDSRVDIVATATADLKGIARLLRGFARGSIPVQTLAAQLGSSRGSAAPGSLLRQSVRFASVGVASTVAYLLLFMLLHGSLGAQAANLIALLVTAIGNTAANRRFTFGIADRAGAARHHVEGLIVFGIALAITSGALATAACRRPRARTVRRRHRPGRGQPARHRRSIRAAARLGVPPAPKPMIDPKHEGIHTDDDHCRRRHTAGRGTGRRAEWQAALGHARAAGLVGGHGGAVPVGPRLVGLGQQLLRCRGTGGHAGLDGLAVRIP